jgi:hypothetical protein
VALENVNGHLCPRPKIRELMEICLAPGRIM